MRILIATACCCCLLLTGVPSAAAAEEAAPMASPVSADHPSHGALAILGSLGWLEGNWVGGGFEATYSSPKGGVMVSMSKYYEDGMCVFVDFERWEAVDGKILMTPSPMGHASVSFTLVGFDPAVRRLRVENLEHDWPTSITYELLEPDLLRVIAAGPGEGGAEQVETMDLQRVP
ncbi:MAG TPA: DUF6265 family protein [bacterium]|nr:DUF6265 family protein [bacterium]